jgi:calcineurin-like phosphoesterase family protein/RNAse (barnase) inhibitor barstar
MTTWFTSDLHFGHANIIEYSGRPFTDAEQMNQSLIERWNELVRPGDDVWVLGDVAMGRITDTLPLVGRLAGNKHLVTGNHDRCWDGLGSRADEWTERYLAAGFADIHQGAIALRLGGHEVLACHFPYRGDSQDFDRYPEARPLDAGGWLLHGHVHEQWRQRERMINVGCDAWDCRPVAEATLVALIEAGPEDLTPLPGGVPVIDIDGSAIYDRDDFYDQVGERLIPGAAWGRNLDAFDDILHGGFGTPSGPFVIRWHQSATTRARLGGDFDVMIAIIREHATDGTHLDLR